MEGGGWVGLRKGSEREKEEEEEDGKEEER